MVQKRGRGLELSPAEESGPGRGERFPGLGEGAGWKTKGADCLGASPGTTKDGQDSPVKFTWEGETLIWLPGCWTSPREPNGLVDEDLTAPQVQSGQLQAGHLLHPQPVPEHQLDHGPVPVVMRCRDLLSGRQYSDMLIIV